MSLKIDPDWWKHLFDEIYLMTDARTVCNDEITRREIDIFGKVIPLHPKDHILDLCGGHGRHALELSRRGFSGCMVFDYSNTLLAKGAEEARRRNCPVRFVQGDARDTKLDADKFDHVMILGNSLGYIPDEHADFQILQEGLRVLKPGGWLLLDVADGKSAREKLAPVVWHEIGENIVVCRQREIIDGFIRARELVLCKNQGLIRDKNYCIRLYASEPLAGLASKAGFADVRVHSDCALLESKEDVGCMNHRLLLSARKP
jgi:D-alanine-D-alanine ligase